MFKSQQYRAKATEYGELVKTSTSPEEGREFQKLERRFASLADNEQVLADDHKSAVNVSNHDQSRGAALAVEEEYVLRCLGAALIMQWNTLPTTLQRETLRHRRVRGQFAGDSGAAGTDRPVSAQAQECWRLQQTDSNGRHA
jgi:hypothetical protein